MNLGLFVLGEPPGLVDCCAACTSQMMLYMDPEAGKTPWIPPLTIGRVYFPNEQQRLSNDPVVFGRDAAARCIERARATGIQIWMSTNEPDVSSTDAMTRLVAFEREFTTRMNAEGLRCGVFSLSVGWPRQIEGTKRLDTQPLDAFLRTLPTNNLVFLHQYFTPAGVYEPFTYPDGRVIRAYTDDGPSLCQRQEWWPQIDRHKIAITECGMDIHGRPQLDGWRAQCPPGMNLEEWFARYCVFMSDYMELISIDNRVLGAVWFCAGPGWSWGQYDILTHWRQAAPLLRGTPVVLPTTTPVVIPPPALSDTIRVKISATQMVKTLPLEEYLRAVVPAEMPALWHPEAVRAQAVLARSYALACIATRKDHTYDVDDTISFQVYTPSLTHPASDAAVKATAGIYLVKGGKPFLSEYVARCGQVDCPFCNGAGGSVTSGNPSGVWPGRFCQYGAKVLAEQGMPFRNIATFYYDDVTLSDE